MCLPRDEQKQGVLSSYAGSTKGGWSVPETQEMGFEGNAARDAIPKVVGEIIWFLPSNKRQITSEHEKQPLEFEKRIKAMSVSEGKQTVDLREM